MTEPIDLPGLAPVGLRHAGASADVFEYRRERSHAPVAVKIARRRIVDEEDRSRTIAMLGTLVAVTAHPGLLSVYSAGVTADGRAYAVMEYCAGPTLAETARSRRLGVAEVLRTLVRLAGAVDAAHRAGLARLGISADHVFTSGDDGPVLAVRWQARQTSGAVDAVDVAADLRGLAGTAVSALERAAPAERGAMRIERRDVPPALRRLLETTLSAPAPEDGPSAAAFATRLQRIEADAQLPVTPVDPAGDEHTALSPHRAVAPEDHTVLSPRGSAVPEDHTVVSTRGSQPADDRTRLSERRPPTGDESTVLSPRRAGPVADRTEVSGRAVGDGSEPPLDESAPRVRWASGPAAARDGLETDRRAVVPSGPGRTARYGVRSEAPPPLLTRRPPAPAAAPASDAPPPALGRRGGSRRAVIGVVVGGGIVLIGAATTAVLLLTGGGS